MKVEFKDFYGQNIDVHNETASGNLRMRVRTMKDMNQIRGQSVDECDTMTDISLTAQQVEFLISSLSMMIVEEE